MISGISGKIISRKSGSFIIKSGTFCYEVLVPGAVMRAVDKDNAGGDDIELVTYHYLQLSQSSAVPVLIGFRNDIEKEFFEKFISVSGIGPRAACRALAEDFSRIASAIDAGDESVLKALPGIGGRKAAEIIAKLKGKVGKYCLIKDISADGETPGAGIDEDIQKEAIEVLKLLIEMCGG